MTWVSEVPTKFSAQTKSAWYEAHQYNKTIVHKYILTMQSCVADMATLLKLIQSQTEDKECVPPTL